MQNFIQKILDQKISLAEWLLGFSGILMVRFFLEALSSKTSSGFLASDASTLMHYYLFYLSFILVFMFFLKYFVFKEEQGDMVPKVALYSFAVIFFAPIFDYIYALIAKNSFSMGYIFDGWPGILKYFSDFFGPSLYQGITLGIRIEVLLILISIFYLTYKIKKSLFKSTVAIVVLYAFIFLFLSAPSFIGIIFGSAQSTPDILAFFARSFASISAENNLHSSLEYGSFVRFFEISFNFVMAKIFFVSATILGCFWFYTNNKQIFLTVIKNSRFERVAHYIFMLILGIVFTADGFSVFGIFNWIDWLTLLTLFISIYCAWMFAVHINDIVDVNIDKITNKDRPLAEERLSRENMQEFGMVFLLTSVVGGFLSGYSALFFLLTFIALYYIYSAPPTRFKTIPFFSSFIIGLCCLSVVLAGFFTFSPSKEVASFKAEWAIGITLIFFLWSHIRDMKDIEGDKQEGVPTVPVIFGKNGPLVVGVLSSSAYLLVPVFFGLWTLIPAIPASVLNYYLVKKQPYKEKPVFLVYGLFTFSLLALYFLL
ncbi:MAG: UbiA family prenyltransferase [Patescibacteria group bacterium]